MKYVASAVFSLLILNSAQACPTSPITAEVAASTYADALDLVGAATSGEDWGNVRLVLECLSMNGYSPASELMASLLLGSEFGAPDLVSAHEYLRLAFENGDAQKSTPSQTRIFLANLMVENSVSMLTLLSSSSFRRQG